MRFIIRLPSNNFKEFVVSLGVSGFEDLSENKVVGNIISFYLNDSGNFIKADIYPIKYEINYFKEGDIIYINREDPIPLDKEIIDLFPYGVTVNIKEVLARLHKTNYTKKSLEELVLMNESKYFNIKKRGSLEFRTWECKRIN